MTPQVCQLLAALDQAHAAGDDTRLLRLLANNLHRYPEFPSLRRFAWRLALAVGETDMAGAIMHRTIDLELAAGNLLAAVAALRAAENAGVEIETGWQDVFFDISSRGFGAICDETPEESAAPDLESDGPPLSDDELLSHVLVIAASAPEPQLERSLLQPLPWFSALDQATLRLNLRLLDGARVDPGTRFVVADQPPAWLVLGDLRDDASGTVPVGAALVGEPHGTLTAHSTCWMVTFPVEVWDELQNDPIAVRAWKNMLRRRRLLRTLQALPILTLRDTSRLARALQTSEIHVRGPGTIPLPIGRPTLRLTIVHGTVYAETPEGDQVGSYSKGDAIEMRIFDGLRVYAQDDVEFALVDLDDDGFSEELVSGELQIVDVAH